MRATCTREYRPRTIRLAFVVALVAFASACGGGGGGGSPPAPSPPAPQSPAPPSPVAGSVSFQQLGPIAAVVDETFANPATGLGTGAVSYTSSDESVAVVNNAGQVTALAAGSATITAVKTADSQYQSASASYVINVTLVPQTLTFAQSGPLSLPATTSVANAASGPGPGIIAYSTSNPSVATVNDAGLLTAVGVGDATVSATIAADRKYAAASASYSVNVTRMPRSLTFSKGNAPVVSLGSALANVASAPGSGLVTYSSNDAAVANVDATGLVTSLGLGTVQITATKPADSQYEAATASYRLKTSVDMTAWIGPQDTLLQFPSVASGLELVRSRDADCALSNYLSCDHGQADALSGAQIVDTAATLSTAGHYVLRQGAHQAKRVVSNAHFSGRQSHQVAMFKGKLWLIGGTGVAGDHNDVWSSDDGTSWTLMTSSAAFTPRHGHSVVEFDGKLWLIGGTAAMTHYNDVWSSSDGITWTLQTANAAFSGRWRHKSLVFNGKIWAIGGIVTGGGSASDVWASSDGVSWALQSSDVGAANGEHHVRLFGGKLWMLDGIKQVWTSADGIEWRRETTAESLNGRSGFQLVVFGGKLMLFGGFDALASPPALTDEVWSSNDGIQWALAGHMTGAPPRTDAQLVVFGDELRLIGGRDERSRDDVWASSDGFDWRQLAGRALPPRALHQLIAFNNKLWQIGGLAENTSAGDIWSSTDGVSWTLVTREAPFSVRTGHQMAVFANQVWLIGGGYGSIQSDVWSSTDGVSWTLRTASPGFSARQQHQVVAFDNKLWVIGGVRMTSSGSGPIEDDVWTSTDGVSWTQVSVPFDRRNAHQAVVFAGKLWIYGGRTGSGFGDSWSTTDGVNWTAETGVNPAISTRAGHQVKAFQGRLWFIGGGDPENPPNKNDIWSSADGVTWTEETPAAPFDPVRFHQVAVHDDKLWLFGGFDAGLAFQNTVWSSSDGVTWRTPLRGVIETN